MKKTDFYHVPKTVDAYAIDRNHFHIRLKSTKGVAKRITLIWGDGFEFKMIDGEHLWQHQLVPMTLESQSSDFDYWSVIITPKFKRIKYGFIIDNTYLLGNRDLIDYQLIPKITYQNQEILYRLFNFPWMNEADILEVPSWVSQTIWYQIFPDSFRKFNQDFAVNENSDHERPLNQPIFHGGNIKGIIEKLDYLHDLGVNGLYFTPLFKSLSQHKYDTIDYFEIDPAFGTKEDLKELVEKAHGLGIKIMLDAVFNHTSYYHPFFLDIVKHGKESKYYGYYKFFQDPPINFEVDEFQKPLNGRQIYEKIHLEGPFLSFHAFAFGYGMPKTDFDHPEMREYLLSVGEYWIREFNIDGWRLDVANEVSHDFWRAFRKRCKAAKNDVFILGENWYDSEPWLRGDQFDGGMNFDLMFSVWSFFSKKAPIKYQASDLIDQYLDYISRYPNSVLPAMFNMLDCHDTERMLSLANHQISLFKLAFAFLFSIVGSPVIYYGDEIGIQGDGLRGNREPMLWDSSQQNKDLLQFFKRLILLRKTVPSMSQLSIEWLPAPNPMTLFFRKDQLYFIFNNVEHEIEITLPGDVNYDLFADSHLLEKTRKLTLKPYEFKIVK